jgi:hypothetical protein
MISKGHPTEERNAKLLRKSGALLFFATDANLLWAREGENWVNSGHVVPLEPPRWNRPKHPKLAGMPCVQDGRLQGV